MEQAFTLSSSHSASFCGTLKQQSWSAAILVAKVHESLRGSKFNLMVLSKWCFQGSTAVSQLGLRFADGPGQGSPLGHCPAVTAGPS